MKHLILLFAASMALFACSREGYLIKGTTDIPEGKAVLTYKTPEGERVSDTVSFQKGRFTLKGRVKDVVLGTLALIPDEGMGIATSIFVENAPINIHIDSSEAVEDGMFGDLASIREPGYTGGPNNVFFSTFCALGQDLEARRKLIAESKDLEAAAYLSRMYFSDAPLEVYDSVFSGFSQSVQASFLAQEAKKELEARKRVAPGCPAPDFTLKDIHGEDFTLSSLRGKYVLIDFWASWCIPCREGMPGLKELYSQYHDKGLEIVGVANDTDESIWKKAIEKDGISWVQLIDEFPEKGKPSRVSTDYAVHFIPAFFLIDRDGSIIGKMEHEKLAEALSDVFD